MSQHVEAQSPMKAVILAGGFGTRISEETDTKPKPMVDIGGMPILWHIMKIYSSHGVNDFVICCGYKGYYIKEYFSNYFLHNSDVTFCMKSNQMRVHRERAEPWTVTLVDTGPTTMTGGRLLRVADYVRDESEFFFTYGDGVSNVDISQSLAFHRSHQKQATLTAAFPPGRFGALDIKNSRVCAFNEKPLGDGGMVNAGFFVLSPEVLNLIEGDSTSWEDSVLPQLANKAQLMAFEHRDFWQPMDTLRDKNHLESLWMAGQAPWKIWE